MVCRGFYSSKKSSFGFGRSVLRRRLREVVPDAALLRSDVINHVVHEMTFQGQASTGANNGNRTVSTSKLKVVQFCVPAPGHPIVSKELIS